MQVHDVDQLIHFMRAVENPEWMVDLVEELKEYKSVGTVAQVKEMQRLSLENIKI